MFGEDDFTLGESLSELKESISSEDTRDVNTSVLDASDLTFHLLRATTDTVPFMAEKRLVIVKGLLSQFEKTGPKQSRDRVREDIKEWDSLSDYLPVLPPTTDLVFVDGRLGQSNSLLKIIRPYAKVLTFRLPRLNDLRRWIRHRSDSISLRLDPLALETLAEIIGPNLYVVANELEKLALYSAGTVVEYKDVIEMVSYVRESNIFAAVDATLDGKTGVAIRIVHQLMASGSSPQYLLVMMARQVRLLLIAKELKMSSLPPAVLSKRLGLSGYPLQKILQQEPKFGYKQLFMIHRELLEADLAIKTLSINNETLLDTLIAKISIELLNT